MTVQPRCASIAVVLLQWTVYSHIQRLQTMTAMRGKCQQRNAIVFAQIQCFNAHVTFMIVKQKHHRVIEAGFGMVNEMQQVQNKCVCRHPATWIRGAGCPRRSTN